MTDEMTEPEVEIPPEDYREEDGPEAEPVSPPVYGASLRQIYPTYSRIEIRLDGTDKGTRHNYIRVYEEMLEPIRHSATAVCELGVGYGASLMMWRDYFTQAEIYGVDRERPAFRDNERGITVYQFEHTDVEQASIAFEDEILDVVIDDGARNPSDQLSKILLWWTKLRPGGMYFIESVEQPAVIMNAIRALKTKGEPQIWDFRHVNNVPDNTIIMMTKPL